jgi:hypothetical protein
LILIDRRQKGFTQGFTCRFFFGIFFDLFVFFRPVEKRPQRRRSVCIVRNFSRSFILLPPALQRIDFHISGMPEKWQCLGVGSV